MQLLPIEIEKFFAKVMKTPRGCWLWTGAILPDTGYGSFYVKWFQKNLGAHRVSFFIANGYLTDGLLVRHLCNNTACVNPAHLAEGTQTDNMQDMIKSGRSLTGKKNPSITHNDKLARGEDNPFHKYAHVKTAVRQGHKKWRENTDYKGSKNPCAKLNENQVIEIRWFAAKKIYNYTELAALYETSKTNIRQIVLRLKWKHI